MSTAVTMQFWRNANSKKPLVWQLKLLRMYLATTVHYRFETQKAALIGKSKVRRLLAKRPGNLPTCSSRHSAVSSGDPIQPWQLRRCKIRGFPRLRRCDANEERTLITHNCSNPINRYPWERLYKSYSDRKSWISRWKTERANRRVLFLRRKQLVTYCQKSCTTAKQVTSVLFTCAGESST